MKLLLVLGCSILVALLTRHFVPASHAIATTLGDHPIKWFMMVGVGFFAFAFLATRKR